jgi:hypothetical protein
MGAGMDQRVMKHIIEIVEHVISNGSKTITKPESIIQC